MITLYHVSYGMNDEVKDFVPKVPDSVCSESGENSEIPRICFADSVEKCFQAKEGLINIGGMFTVYELTIDENDKDLLSPEKLFSKGYVPDALEGHEYWLLRPLTLHGARKILTDIKKSFEIAWTPIKTEDIITILKSLQISYDFVSEDMTAEQIYTRACRDLDSRHEYELEDALYDAVTVLPWAQVLRINKIACMDWNGSPYGIAYENTTGDEVITFFANRDSAETFFGDISAKDNSRIITYDYYNHTVTECSMPSKMII